MNILFKRGVEAKRPTFTPKQGEPVITTDTKELFIGDGVTAGGVPVGTVKPSGSVATGMVALFKDATGKLLQGVTKADFLSEYLTSTEVTSAIENNVPNIKVNAATQSDTALNANKLKDRDDYLNTDNLTSSYQEDSDVKVVRASAIKLMWDAISTSKIDITAITSALNDTSVTKVLSAAAGKGLKDAQEVLKLHLSKLPNQISTGTTQPSNSLGDEGDIYILYD